MDLDINNYDIDELCNIFKTKIININHIILKNDLIKKIYNIENSDSKELENNKVALIKFYTEAYFKIIEFSNENSKLNDINENLKSINENIVNNNILSKNTKNNELGDSPHFSIKKPIDYTLNVFNKNIKAGTINPLYRQVIKKYININTRFRDNYVFTNSNNFSLDIEMPLLNVLSMKVVDYNIPFVVHSISSSYNNNRFKIKPTSDSSYIEIIIDNGSYNAEFLEKEINNKLLSNIDNSNIQIKFVNQTGKWEFKSKNQKNFEIDFFYNNFECFNNSDNNKNSNINYQLTLGWILGFRGKFIKKNIKLLEKYKLLDSKVDIIYRYENKYIGEAIFDPLFNNYFLLSINDFMNNHNNTFITPGKKGSISDENIIARIPATINRFNNFINGFGERIYFGPTNINKLQIKLFDEYCRLVELNHSDYSFTLEIEILYEN